MTSNNDKIDSDEIAKIKIIGTITIDDKTFIENRYSQLRKYVINTFFQKWSFYKIMLEDLRRMSSEELIQKYFFSRFLKNIIQIQEKSDDISF